MADVRFVRVRGRVERQQRDLMSPREELDRERIVAQAAPAIHPGRSRGDGKDPHSKGVKDRVNAEC